MQISFWTNNHNFFGISLPRPACQSLFRREEKNIFHWNLRSWRRMHCLIYGLHKSYNESGRCHSETMENKRAEVPLIVRKSGNLRTRSPFFSRTIPLSLFIEDSQLSEMSYIFTRGPKLRKSQVSPIVQCLYKSSLQSW